MPVIIDMRNKYMAELSERYPDEFKRVELTVCTQVNLVSILMDAKVNNIIPSVLPFLSGKVQEKYRADLQDAFNVMLGCLSALSMNDIMQSFTGVSSVSMTQFEDAANTVNFILAINHGEDHFAGK